MGGRHRAPQTQLQPHSSQLWANVRLGNESWRLRVPLPLLQRSVLVLSFWLWGVLYPPGLIQP